MSVNDSKYNAAASPLPCEHTVFTDLDGLDGVLVDLNTRKYYQLNETASLIWRGLEKRLPVDRIATQMTERYEVSLEQATASIEAALRHFEEAKVVRS